MQTKEGGVFIPDELLHAYASAVLLVGVLFAVGCVAYYLWRGLRRLVIWLRMSKVERAKAYLREHDPEFSRREQRQGFLRRLSAGSSRESRELPKIFRKRV